MRQCALCMNFTYNLLTYVSVDRPMQLVVEQFWPLLSSTITVYVGSAFVVYGTWACIEDDDVILIQLSHFLNNIQCGPN